MTMPKKGSRPVTVDGIPFRFMVTDEGHNKENLRVVVEPAAFPGRTLTVRFGRHLFDCIGGPQVIQIVRHARKTGWSPLQTSSTFEGEDFIRAMLSASLA